MTDENDQMTPESSPDQIGKSGVRRVNNMPMFILAAVAGAFLLVMAMVASDRSAKQNAPATTQVEKAGNTAMYAKEIAGERTSGIVAPERPPSPPQAPAEAGLSEPANETSLTIARPENPDEPPPPPPKADGTAVAQADEEAKQLSSTKLRQLEEAAKAKTTVQMVAPRSAASAPAGASSGAPQTRAEMLARLASVRQQIDAQQSSDDPTAVYKERLQQLKSTGLVDEIIGSESARASTSTMATSTQTPKGYGQFDHTNGDRWQLDSKPEAPRTPYVLRAGFVVPAVLISGINSELPGQIMGQVSQNVYDTATGKYLLVPQGARLVGTYSSDVAYGQARVLVAWQRIVFPDGKAMDIGSMPGADSAGYSGFKDQVNNHFVRLFGSALLMSGITAGITYSQHENQSNSNEYSARTALSEALGQQLGQVTAQLIAKNMNIAPTLEIRPGYRFNVTVTKDLTFTKPYRSFDY